MRRLLFITRCVLAFLVIVQFTGSDPAEAQTSPFEPGWVLDQTASRLAFQSIKNNSIVETSGFATYSGTIDSTGLATIRIELNSVDTKIDLRNVRMRFLFFETFKYPEATISAVIDQTAITELAQRRRMQFPVDYVLNLHGVEQKLQAETVVTLISDDIVSVASASPISIPVKMFGLEEGITKLEEAAKVKIVPSGSVTFDFLFRRAAATAAVAPPPAPKAEKAALETAGNFSAEECAGRFEILSRTGAIYFKSGSAELDDNSGPMLSTVVDIVNRCPSAHLVVEGHTDSRGSDEVNQRLSEERARSVMAYLIASGIEPSRLASVGYGEMRPIAPNDTARDRSRNRRIQFSVAAQ
ncbi:OmpA family protein [Oceanibacterium hippocampi]|uniref:Outer membrane porin F n=1 Tax=Oceanibacterium hippocampi TaxID=745714 RepID=A0A1Y5U0R3_9PROT|nr:OmpA family protein [Oceanibacterium hippocampi]SLN75730.1 Outer membrane porin F precursor [Oceanibacterium hippocampi]